MKTDLVRLSRELSANILSSFGLLLAGANGSQADTLGVRRRFQLSVY